MAPPQPQIPPAAKPKLSLSFDAWNSCTTGHQRAESRTGQSVGWRRSRSTKLSHQFRSGGTGGRRISDQVGPGSEDWDDKNKALLPKKLQNMHRVDTIDMLVSKPLVGKTSKPIFSTRKEVTKVDQAYSGNASKRGIFDGLVVYVNGSTLPLISDHKLKYLLAENGAEVSVHLGRRHVTHVILGRPSGKENASVLGIRGIPRPGSGGGLAGSKIQKESKRVGGCGVKYVGVEWAIESLKAGRRLRETQFAIISAAAGQRSVYGMLEKKINDPVPLVEEQPARRPCDQSPSEETVQSSQRGLASSGS